MNVLKKKEKYLKTRVSFNLNSSNNIKLDNDKYEKKKSSNYFYLKRIIKQITIAFLFISIFFLSLLLCYFFESIADSFLRDKTLWYNALFTLIHLSILGIITFHLFKKDFTQKEKNFSFSPLLLSGIFFYFILISKILNFILYIYSKSFNSDKSNILFLTKINFFF